MRISESRVDGAVVGAEAAANRSGAADRILMRVSEEVGAGAKRRYFDRLARLRVDDEGLDVKVPSRFVASVIDRRFGPALRRAAVQELVGPGGREPVVGLRYTVDTEAFGGETGEAFERAFSSASAMERATRAAVGQDPDGSSADAGPELRLHRDEAEEQAEDASVVRVRRVSPGEVSPRRGLERPGRTPRRRGDGISASHQLETFIVGASNRLACRAAEQVAEGTAGFSPLFIHGACGLGKTHLLQGIAHQYRRCRPGARVRYITAEAFTNEFISAMKGGRLDAFRKAFRRVDLLCVDDVHFLTNKRATQAELLHTFDAVDVEGRSVVLASDEHPRDIAALCEGLVSRFVSGAVTRLDPPDQALRVELLTTFAARRGLMLEPAAIERLAVRAGEEGEPTVRQLEGLIVQLDAARRLLPDLVGSGRIGASAMDRALGLTSGPNASPGSGSGGGVRRPVRIQAIAQHVCDALRVDQSEMLGSGRHRRVVLARALTVYLARCLTTLSFPEIARAIGRPNHSSVITAHKRVLSQMERGEGVGVGPDFDGLTIRDLGERFRRELERRV